MTYSTDLQGLTVAGQYGLRRWLGGDEESAFYLTTHGPEERPAVLKLMADNAEADAQLAVWERIGHLSHPHLLGLLDYGRTRAGDESYIYAVFEYPDDNLAAAVENAPLSESEARDVMAAAIPALEYLHENGLAHTAVDPEHIVAVGETIKLATDTARPLDGEASAAEDARALGALAHKLLGGGDITHLPQPFRRIVAHTELAAARGRWTLREIEEALNAPAAAAPVAPVTPSMPPARHPLEEDREPERASIPNWAYAAMAVALFAIVLFALTRRSAPVAQTAPPETPPAPAAAIPAASPTARPQPMGNIEQSAARATPAARGDWRVIAFTYSRRQDAQKKVEQINAKFPGFLPEVFSSAGHSQVYLVALGGRMTRDEAFSLQRRAISRGFPRDTYAQNFSK